MFLTIIGPWKELIEARGLHCRLQRLGREGGTFFTYSLILFNRRIKWTQEKDVNALVPFFVTHPYVHFVSMCVTN